MTNLEIMQEISKVRNALWNMSVCREQTHIVSGCMFTLDHLLEELNKSETAE